MRNLFLAPVLASLALTTIRPADACGPYMREPKVMRISSHYVDRGTRSFVLTGELDQATAAKLKWTRFAPMSYDYASIAEASDLETPATFTLIGPSGTRVVQSRERVYLSQTFVSHKPSVAMEIEVPKGEFSIAMAGNHARASWITLDTETRGRTKDLAWVKAQHVEPLADEYVYVNKLHGTGFETVTVLPKGGGMTTFVRMNGALYTQFEGAAMGAIDIDGMTYLVGSKHGDAITAIAL